VTSPERLLPSPAYPRAMAAAAIGCISLRALIKCVCHGFSAKRHLRCRAPAIRGFAVAQAADWFKSSHGSSVDRLPGRKRHNVAGAWG
jgi:hypothetical protein